MSKRTFLLAMTAIFLIMGAPQDMCGQNKVKKVKYLGHKYHGEVNQEKNPEGTGIMDYELFTVEGYFDGNIISNPIFKNSQLHFDYIGDASYDDSNNIVLKAGGVMVNYCLIKHLLGNKFIETEISKNQLTKDSVINTKTMNTTKLPVSYEININLPQEINPPKFIISDILELTEYTTDERIQGSVFPEYKKAKGFIGNGLLEKSYNIQGYTDDKGRIWDLENTGVSTSIKGWDIKVVYPDGSFYKGHIGGGYDYSNNLKIVYPNGDVMEHINNWSTKLVIRMQNGFAVGEIEKLKAEEFAKFNNEKTYPSFKLSTIYLTDENFTNMPSANIAKAITDNILVKYKNTEDKIRVFNNNGKLLGNYTEGKYISIEEENAAYNAKVAKEEAAKAKANEEELAPYIRRFGFNPTGKSIKQLVTVGRSYSLVRDYVNNYYVQGRNFAFSLGEDTGISKGYWVLLNRKRVGFIYVQRDRIISVKWQK